MRWEAFWLSRNHQDYEVILTALETHKKALQEKDPEAAKMLINECLLSLGPLKKEFEDFCRATSTKSEQCRYLQILRNSIENLKADRDRELHAHINAVQSLLPLFAECDSINYLQYDFLYLECMKRLPKEHPDIYSGFLQGHFLV